MNIDNLSIGEAREIARIFGAAVGKSHSFEIGKCYLIRTVTMIDVGRCVGVTDSDVVLESAAWIASTDRFAKTLADGKLDEVEPFPNRAYVSRGAIVDFAEWCHDLPREQK